jgi:hypothetical protein
MPARTHRATTCLNAPRLPCLTSPGPALTRHTVTALPRPEWTNRACLAVLLEIFDDSIAAHIGVNLSDHIAE